MDSGGKGFIVLFRLSCLNMINQRFGPEAVEDCLMAVAAFLTQSLHSDDAIYHWSDSSLLAILQGRANEQILTAELERIIMQNRETSVNIGGRSTMLRIPITFDLTPIERLQSADDLYKITLLTATGGTMKRSKRCALPAAPQCAPRTRSTTCPCLTSKSTRAASIMRANPAALALHHPGQGDLVGRSGWDLIAVDEKDFSSAAFLSLMASGKIRPS